MLMKVTCMLGRKEVNYLLELGKDYYLDLDSVYLDSDNESRGTVYKDKDLSLIHI